VSPAFGAGWTYTSEAARRALLPGRAHTEALANGTQIGPWTPGDLALDRQYVSRPLRAQTINGTVRMQLRVREFADDDNTTSQLRVAVYSNDGTVLRGELLAIGNYGPATEYVNSATLRNKTFADGDAVSSLAVLAGDRLVVEVGHTDAAGATPEAQASWGAPHGTVDLPINETGTTAQCPWIEFSEGLLFEAAPVNANQTLEDGFVAEETGPFVTNEAPTGLEPCVDPITAVTFRIGTVLPRTLDLATLVVTLQEGFDAPIIAYDGSAGGFQPGYSGSVTDVSTPLEDLRDVSITKDAGFPSDVVVRVFVALDDDLGTSLAPPVSWMFCAMGAFLATPDVIPKDGGAEVIVEGPMQNGTIRVHFGPLGTIQDPLCYSGIPGQGSTIEVASSSFTFRAPPAPVGGPYALFIERLTGGGPATQVIEDLITVIPHDFKSGTLRLRQTLPRTWLLGYTSVDLEDFPQ
jgi:hypothetical protein